MWPNLQKSADLVTFTEEILNGKVVSGEIKTVCSEEAEKKGTVNLVAIVFDFAYLCKKDIIKNSLFLKLLCFFKVKYLFHCS